MRKLIGLTESFHTLYNALTLAANLRYGLDPRGIDILRGATIKYGVTLVNEVCQAIVRASFNFRDKIRIARKMEFICAALKAQRESGGLAF